MAAQLSVAVKHNDAGLTYFREWQIDDAVTSFQAAIQADPDNPEYHLNLARTYARGTHFDKAMQSLGDFLRTETDEDVTARYERLFSSALDEVEEVLIEKMRGLKLPMQQIGKAIQMWLEYRITIGRRPLRTPKPELWAAALAFAVCRVNFTQVSREEVAGAFAVNERSLKQKYDDLVEVLDIMPADYRYYIGDENPLDKLVEAAQELDELYARFHDD